MVFHKKKGAKAKSTDHAVANAHRSGGGVSSSKKYNAGSNSQGAGLAMDSRKLDTDEIVAPPTVTHDLKVAIQQARQKKGWSQKQLATAINEKQSVVQSYESGKAVPTPQVISKLERKLGLQPGTLSKLK